MTFDYSSVLLYFDNVIALAACAAAKSAWSIEARVLSHESAESGMLFNRGARNQRMHRRITTYTVLATV